MRARQRLMIRGAAVAIVLGATVIAVAQVGNGNVVANPPVTFILTSGGSGSGATVLDNTSGGGYLVELAPDAACGAGVDFQIIGANPFTLAGSATKSIGLTCAMGQPGMERCLVHAVDANTGDALADLLAVCERAGSANLVPSPTLLDFGTVVVGETVTLPLQLDNQGATTIRRLFFQTDDLDGNFELSAPCNPDAAYCDGPVPPFGLGSATTVFVNCSPRSPGTHQAELEVATDTSQHASQRVMLSCTGSPATVPVLGVSPTTIEIAAPVEVVTATAHSTLRLENLGTGSVLITDIRSVDVDGGAAADWTLSLTGTCTGTPCTLPAGQEVAVDLVFDPSAIGARHASLLISFHDTIDRTRSIPLAGIGQGATLERLGPQSVLDLGTVPIGRMASLDFGLINRGNRDTTAGLSIAPVGPYTLTPATSTTVMPTAPATITATCAPTGAGTVSATITADSSDTIVVTPVDVATKCTGSTAPLYATPSALALGEIRIEDGGKDLLVQIASTAGVLTIAGTPHLDPPNTNLSVDAPTSATTPTAIPLRLDPISKGDITTNLVVEDTAGDTILIPISGRVVSAAYVVPSALDIGTFCVGQPTASSNVSLTSTGGATLGIAEPVLPLASPFELGFTAPTIYPATILPTQAVTVAVTPQRQASATTIDDTLTWTTDVATKPTAATAITARFIDSGGAIAPPILDFGKVPVHLYVDDGQRVMIQNCNTTVLELESADDQVAVLDRQPELPDQARSERDRHVLGGVPPHAHRDLRGHAHDLVAAATSRDAAPGHARRREPAQPGPGLRRRHHGAGRRDQLLCVQLHLGRRSERRAADRARARAGHRPAPLRIFLSSPKNRSISSGFV